MSVRDADILERVILRIAALRSPLRVLEWGSGKSTGYFPRSLSERGFSCKWTAIEHDPDWARKTVGSLHPSASVQSIPLGDAYPEVINGLEPDIAIVDGRLRRRCLLSAAQRAGVVVLHDAQREYYHCAFQAYRHQGRVGDMLWIGSQDFALHEAAHGRSL
jgi:hypothetical protein